MLINRLETLFKWLFILSAIFMFILYFYKDRLPKPSFYNLNQLNIPQQTPTEREPFSVTVNKQHYTITPKFNYELEGVVVSLSNAGQFGDIWHYSRWKDFLNVRDICVIWGENVRSGIYQKMSFKSDTWTCWAYWPDYESSQVFSGKNLSNNHVLAHKYLVKKALMKAELGDHVRMKGILADYRNNANGFFRKSSIIRADTGNGACETVYLSEFEIIKKANGTLRLLYSLSKYIMFFSFILYVILFFITPPKHTP